MDNIPYGYCHCGCGKRTKIANKTSQRDGTRKGRPLRYLRGHNGLGAKKPIPQAIVMAHRKAWIEQHPDIPYGYCHCGCGEQTELATSTRSEVGWVQGEPKRFVHGHNRRMSGVEYIIEDRGYKTPCWIWQRGTSANGYGRTGNPSQPAHRVYYERFVGPVAEGLEPDHLCRVRPCIRPDHLELVTHLENCRRGERTKLTQTQSKEIRALYSQGTFTYGQIAALYNVGITTIRRHVFSKAVEEDTHGS